MTGPDDVDPFDGVPDAGPESRTSLPVRAPLVAPVLPGQGDTDTPTAESRTLASPP